jgi:hypothetical protein
MDKLNDNEENNEKINSRKDLIIHIIILFILFIICIWDRIINIPKFPKNFLFLTQIDLYTNIIYYSIYLYFNIIKKKEIQTKYQLLFNFNFCLSFCVCFMYWSMLIFDKQTLYKKDSNKMVPTALNILLHGGVFICNLFLIFLSKRKEKIIYVQNWFYLLFSIAYVVILYLLNILFDIRVYPFIYGSLLKFILICLSAFAVCLIGHWIYYLMTRETAPKSKEKNFQQFELN